MSYDAPDQVALSSNPIATQTRIHRVYGRLPGARRKAVRRDVARVVDRWWEAAYLGGTYPRTDLPGRVPRLHPRGHAPRACDTALMTNQTGGSRIESVTPLMRKVRLDLLAVGRRARSVTARFDLRFATTRAPSRAPRCAAALFLTRRTGRLARLRLRRLEGERP